MARRVAIAWALALAVAAGAERVFRDIHGAEHHRHPTTVLVDPRGGGDPTRDDDVLRRHWCVVCADRRNPRERQMVR